MVGKGLGGALYPISAVIAKESFDVCEEISLGHYTHEKSPLGAAVGLALIEYIEKANLLEKVEKIGNYMRQRLQKMQERFACIGDVRSIGALLAVELVKDRESKEKDVMLAERILYRCLEYGLSFKVSQGNVLTLAPPLIISQEELTRAMDILEKAIEEQ